MKKTIRNTLLRDFIGAKFETRCCVILLGRRSVW